MAQATSAQPKITLHWLEVSRAHRIMWLLEELNVPYELKVWKRTESKQADPKLKEVHPLGKSPVLTVEAPGEKPIVLIESANIVEYICHYYGQHLIPKRYQEGKEGKIGSETEGFLRYRTFMHYAEGSLMPLMVTSLLVKVIRDAPVWFFIKPITNGVADNLTNFYLKPNFKTHYTWLESQLETAPDGGPYLCGKDLSAADIMMSFPFEGGKSRSGMTKEDCPRIWAYVDLLHENEAYKRSIKKIEEIEGTFKSNL